MTITVDDRVLLVPEDGVSVAETKPSRRSVLQRAVNVIGLGLCFSVISTLVTYRILTYNNIYQVLGDACLVVFVLLYMLVCKTKVCGDVKERRVRCLHVLGLLFLECAVLILLDVYRPELLMAYSFIPSRELPRMSLWLEKMNKSAAVVTWKEWDPIYTPFDGLYTSILSHATH